jgi:hypothetical protein
MKFSSIGDIIKSVLMPPVGYSYHDRYRGSQRWQQRNLEEDSQQKDEK